MNDESTRTTARLAAEAIDGYKVGLAGGELGFISAAFDCGWTWGAQERVAAQATVPADEIYDPNEQYCDGLGRCLKRTRRS